MAGSSSDPLPFMLDELSLALARQLQEEDDAVMAAQLIADDARSATAAKEQRGQPGDNALDAKARKLLQPAVAAGEVSHAEPEPKHDADDQGGGHDAKDYVNAFVGWRVWTRGAVSLSAMRVRARA